MKYSTRQLNKEDWLAITKDVFLPMTQTFDYSDWHTALGRTVLRFAIDDENKNSVAIFQIFKFDLRFGKNYLYIPHGPVFLSAVSVDFWEFFKNFILSEVADTATVFVRFDLSNEKLHSLNFDHSLFYKVPKRMYYRNYQPKFESVINLSKNENELKSSIHRTARYLINVPLRRGVVVEIVNSDKLLSYFDDFYNLLETTAQKDKFRTHGKAYYRAVFENMAKEGNGFLVVLKKGTKIVLANLVYITPSKEAVFLFGGSQSHLSENKGISYLGQWIGITEAKARGCFRYNFGGFWLPELGEFNQYFSWEGFSKFKQKFGGEVLEYTDFYDIIVKPFWYKITDLKKAIRFINLI